VKVAGKSDVSAGNMFGYMNDDATTSGSEICLCDSSDIVICCSGIYCFDKDVEH
jgi:hypothetical protein